MDDGSRPVLDRHLFEQLAERHRREIQLHCYRMLGSVHDAEDAAQESFLRAWRGRHGFEGRSSFRGWLYRIATNACLRMLERRSIARRVLPQAHGPAVEFEPLADPAADVPWLEPYPISPLEAIPDPAPGPEARYLAHEAVQLAFVAAIQALPPRQRAALLLRDVLGMSGDETARILETSRAASNAALQRARTTLQRRFPRGEAVMLLVPAEVQGRLLERYVRTWESADVDRFIDLLAAEATWSMPPWPQWFIGRARIGAFLTWAWRNGGGGRLVPTWANGQPAFGYYRPSTDGSGWRPFAIQVLELRGGAVSSITNFVGAELFGAFGLPATLVAPSMPADR